MEIKSLFFFFFLLFFYPFTCRLELHHKSFSKTGRKVLICCWRGIILSYRVVICNFCQFCGKNKFQIYVYSQALTLNQMHYHLPPRLLQYSSKFYLILLAPLYYILCTLILKSFHYLPIAFSIK